MFSKADDVIASIADQTAESCEKENCRLTRPVGFAVLIVGTYPTAVEAHLVAGGLLGVQSEGPDGLVAAYVSRDLVGPPTTLQREPHEEGGGAATAPTAADTTST